MMNTLANSPTLESAFYDVPHFSKILVAVDRAADSTQIIETAMDIAAKSGCSLMLFSCLADAIALNSELLAAGSLGLYGSTYTRELIEQSEQLIQAEIERMISWLQSLQQEAIDQGIPAEVNYETGEPGPKICARAKTWGADLIVIGRRGRKGLTEMFLGSTSNYIVHHAPCSVLIVQ